MAVLAPLALLGVSPGLAQRPAWPRKPIRMLVAYPPGGVSDQVARELAEQPKLLLVNQPTRGVDIGAIEFIHGRLRAMRDDGGAVLLVSMASVSSEKAPMGVRQEPSRVASRARSA